MDNKQTDLLRRKQDQTDVRFRDYVNDISGGSLNANRDMRVNKTRIVDEQNKMIDKQNLRK